MNILVTGGAGFIGYHLIEALLKEGHTVVCVDNMNEYYDPALKEARLARIAERIEFFKINIADQAALESVFKSHSFDAVCHLAAQAGVRYSVENPFVYAESNFTGTLNVLEFSRRYGVKHVVAASSSSVYGENKKIPFEETDRTDQPVSTYAATKKAGEVLAYAYHHLYGMNSTCIRFFTVYGPFGRPDMALFKFAKSILEGKPIDVYNNGNMRRDFTYVSDIVDGFVAALSKPLGYEILNLGRSNPVQLMDFIKVLEKELGTKAQMNMLPMQQGDVPETYADISKARKMLGYEPKVSVEEGVKKFVEWYRSYYGV